MFHSADRSKAFMALGFESEDSYNLVTGWLSHVSYFTLGYTN